MPNLSSPNKSQLLLIIFILAALVGFGDALYLTIQHYTGGAVVCNVVQGCNVVLSSAWATIGGVPVALLGVGYYGLLLVTSLAYYIRSQPELLAVMLGVSTVGLVVSLAFLYVQLGVIGAVCEYCLLSLLSTAVVWVSSQQLFSLQNDTMNA